MSEEFKNALRGLRDADPDRDYIVITNLITRELHSQLSQQLELHARKKAATVFLTTYGGDPDGGYRIARCLRHFYKDKLRIVVPSMCKSAGTLIAIAGDEIAIGDLGELGPLDIQVWKGSELQERSSGLDITEALGFVSQQVKQEYHNMLTEAKRLGLSTKLAAEMAAQVSGSIAAPLLGQIDPLRIGELQRATRIAADYGNRLNEYSRNLKDGALQRLIHGYPSHSFVIDRKEAKTLFHRVQPLNDAEQTLAVTVWQAVGDQHTLPPEVLDFSILDAQEQEQGPHDDPQGEDAGREAEAPAAPAGDRGVGAGEEGLRVRGNGREVARKAGARVGIPKPPINA